MIFGGFQPLTLLDYPGQVACIAFTQGCNLRCCYCHNRQLIATAPGASASSLSEHELLAILERRRGLLDGIVVTGGEPTLQHGLIDFLGRVKSLGLRIKLDTNGTNPAVLAEALRSRLLDYVAMDVKHDPEHYAEITGIAVDRRTIAASRDLLLASGVAHEFRTTVCLPVHDAITIEKVAVFCQGASRLILQSVRVADIPATARYNLRSTTAEELQYLKRVAEQILPGRVCTREPAATRG